MSIVEDVDLDTGSEYLGAPTDVDNVMSTSKVQLMTQWVTVVDYENDRVDDGSSKIQNDSETLP